MSDFTQQLEEANRELEAAINANDMFRRNMLDPAAGRAAAAPSSPTSRGLGTAGTVTNSVMAKWAAIPAAPIYSSSVLLEHHQQQQQHVDPADNHNNNNHSSSSSASASQTNNRQQRRATPNDPTLLSSASDHQRLEAMIQAAMAKETERIDNHIRDTIARDADARAQHLDNVLRGRFAELQAHNDSTGQVLALIGESLKAVKGETATLSKQFDDKTAKLLEAVSEEQRDRAEALTRALERLDKRVGGLEDALQTERVARTTRLDALELRVQELRGGISKHVETSAQALREEMRSIDSDLSALHREWGKSFDALEEVKKIKTALREVMEDGAGRRSDIRQLKSDVLNLDVFMRMRASSSQDRVMKTMFGGGDGTCSSGEGAATTAASLPSAESMYMDMQTLRESVSFLAAAMKHHGLLSVDGPPLRSDSSLVGQQQRGGGGGTYSSSSGAAAAAAAGDHYEYKHNPNGGTRQPDFREEHPDLPSAYYSHGRHHQQQRHHHNNTSTARKGFRQTNSASSSPVHNNNYPSRNRSPDQDPSSSGGVPPLASAKETPVGASRGGELNNNNNNNQSNNTDTNDGDEITAGTTGTLPSADEEDPRLVRSPID